MITDFSYGGERLSEHGLIIASVDGSPGSDTLEWASQLEFNTIQNKNSGINYTTSAGYSEVYAPTFQVIKYSCLSGEPTYISDTEYRYLSKWLNRKDNLDFSPISDNEEFNGYHFFGSFNVKPIVICADIVGLELTFQSNAPYGFGDVIKIEKTGTKFDIACISDELGYQPIKTTVKLLDDGDLSITNTFTGEITMVKNCVKGEKIVFDSENLIITSNVEHERLYNDFNYIYPRLFTDYRNSTNTIETSISCAILVEYRPIRKVGVVT